MISISITSDICHLCVFKSPPPPHPPLIRGGGSVLVSCGLPDNLAFLLPQCPSPPTPAKTSDFTAEETEA